MLIPSTLAAEAECATISRVRIAVAAIVLRISSPWGLRPSINPDLCRVGRATVRE
jgi:hypothetical protein